MGNNLCDNTPQTNKTKTMVVGKERQKKTNSLNMPAFYQLNQFIAQGSSGEVRRCGEYAVKIIDLSYSQDKQLDIIANQLKIIRSTQHENIVKYYEDFIDGKQGDYKICMVMEWCQTTLRRYLSTSKDKRISENQAIQFLQQILDGYQYLKNNGVVHRDLKPQNILLKSVNDKMIIKIADFGLSKIVHNFDQAVLKTRVGSNVYMSPQVLQNQEYSTKSQIWSLGIILYEMICGERLWKGRTQFEVLNNIKNKPLQFPSNAKMSNQTKELIIKMLQIQPKNRIQWNLLFPKVDEILTNTNTNTKSIQL